tara:strand:+ start:220 stop:495 length:276 start_codon:yes stop_codon:yes gene_type:complete
MDINIKEDLNAVNDQVRRLVEELNKINSARDSFIQQIQNLNGVAMYLRGKQSPEEQGQKDVLLEEASKEAPAEVEITEPENMTRTVEYPNE